MNNYIYLILYASCRLLFSRGQGTMFESLIFIVIYFIYSFPMRGIKNGIISNSFNVTYLLGTYFV